MVTASPPYCILVIGGIPSLLSRPQQPASAAADEHETTTTTIHSYTKPTQEQLPAGYDPNRIPASVFTTEPSNHTEWSIASTESMFSIYMGPSNSSKDISLIQINSQESSAISHDSSNSFFSLPALPHDDHNGGMNSSSSSSSNQSMAKPHKETCTSDAARSSAASTTQLSEARAGTARLLSHSPYLRVSKDETNRQM